MLKAKPRTRILRQLIAYRIPAYVIAPLVLIIFLMGYILPHKTASVTAPSEIRITSVDTVYLKLPADTIYVDRVVVKYKTDSRPAQDFSLVKNLATEDESSEGVSMKEKEELEKFLVSGS